MKKWIAIFCLFILTITSILYFLIPATQNASYQIIANCTDGGAARKITNKENWQLWWPGQKINDTTYSYQNCTYRFDKILLNGIETTIFNNKDSVKGFLQFAYFGNDSTQFQWTGNQKFSANPFIRFQEYFELKKYRNNVEKLLADIKKIFDHPENIYGLKVATIKIQESSMISFRSTLQHYPTTAEIYGMIQSVKEYIQKKGGEEAGHPMLHVEIEGPATYEVMVAIPTKTDLPAEGQFLLKKMSMGYMLKTEVKGGYNRVTEGEKELTNYLKDYKKNSPAIPFQSLVTDRLAETDSTKWITELYYPVFE
jgi:hypothetical protein